jgi:hypothetical protein
MAASAIIDETVVYRMVVKAVEDAVGPGAAEGTRYTVIDQHAPEVESPLLGVQVRVTVSSIVPVQRNRSGLDEPAQANAAVVCMVRATAAAMSADPLLIRKACTRLRAALNEGFFQDSNVLGGWGGTNHEIQLSQGEIDLDGLDEQTLMAFGSVSFDAEINRPAGTSLQA